MVIFWLDRFGVLQGLGSFLLFWVSGLFLCSGCLWLFRCLVFFVVSGFLFSVWLIVFLVNNGMAAQLSLKSAFRRWEK